MSESFNSSPDPGVHTVPLSHRDLQLGMSSENHYSNSSLSASSESSSSISNPSHGEDVDIRESSVSDVDNPSVALSQSNVLFAEREQLNQVFIATPVISSVNFWKENVILSSNPETGSDDNRSFVKNTEDGSNHSVVSLDSAEKLSRLGSCMTFHRGSTENDCCSLSSGEMVLRSSSFCLEEHSRLVVSSLEESSTSSPAGRQAVPAESDLLSTSYRDVCKKSQEKLAEKTNHPCLGMTFIQAEVSDEEKDKEASNRLVTLPSEACTPEQGKDFVPTLSAVQDTDEDVHTSTPIQNIEDKTFYMSSPEKSPNGFQTYSKPTPKKAVPNKVEVRSGSALGQAKPPVLETRPRCSSDSSLSFRPAKHQNQNCPYKSKPVIPADATDSPTEYSMKFKKMSLVKLFSKSKMAGASRDESKSRFPGRLSLRPTGGTPLSQAPAVRPPPATLLARQREATLGRDECRASKDGVSGGATGRATPVKSTLPKPRLGATPTKHIGKLDKSKPKAISRQQQASRQSNRPQDAVPASVTRTGREDQSNQRLSGLLAASNCRFEALTIVLQQTLAENDEATRQCRALSQELVHLRGELDCSVLSSELLEREKGELHVALEDALQKLQEQHQNDLANLEQRLQAFYQAEWDKAHLTYQEEAHKCKSLMQQQIEGVEANHEAMKQELEDSHAEQLQCVKQHYEMSLEDLRKVHKQELQSQEKSLKDTESALTGQMEALTAENSMLIEKVTAEEKRRKQLADSSQKDAHTLYLEQELESLKVVLDIKNDQLHQQKKNLVEIDKLKDKNVTLKESLDKILQENEELKARMDKHASLSRQLSTEQSVLQESLQKESKVNKRLSMENEELLWKLQNGELNSTRRVSSTSTSPSRSFCLQSPRSSELFSSPPMSPR
ncbi:microtubule-associated tumor suppressor 1 homolog [Brachionichthys hirsutus]|uniref:microtubule-associated tumor suppressor 1 homolog n=1 Tax=Brachionichthys hirsutus TaxID=412623 RepID=UPI0036049C22